MSLWRCLHKYFILKIISYLVVVTLLDLHDVIWRACMSAGRPELDVVVGLSVQQHHQQHNNTGAAAHLKVTQQHTSL